MSELLALTDGKLSVNLHKGQTQAWESNRRFVFIIAGTQGGKTSFIPVWLDREIARMGRGDYLAVTATYDLFKLKFLPEMQHYFTDLFGWQYQAAERVLWREDKPRMFTRIILRSADAGGGLESATAKAAALDECGQDKFTLAAWEAVQRRLSLSQGRVLGATTPYNLGWLKSQVYDLWRAGDPDFEVVQFRSIDNPSFPRDEYERMRGKLPTWKFEMFYNGSFARPAGLIYEDFTENHIIPAFDVPAEWPRYLGVDFGANNTAKVWIAHDPGKGLYVIYRESLEGGKTTAEHAKEVTWYNDYNLRAWGGAKSEVQQRTDYAAAGLYIDEPPISDVEAGIDRVIELLKERRLYVFNTCTGIIDEFGTYSRELDSSGQPTEKIRNKSDYHRLDALRYVASGMSATTWLIS